MKWGIPGFGPLIAEEAPRSGRQMDLSLSVEAPGRVLLEAPADLSPIELQGGTFRRKQLDLTTCATAQARLTPPAPVQKWGLRFGCGCEDFTYQEEAAKVGTQMPCGNGHKTGAFVAESWPLWATGSPRR